MKPNPVSIIDYRPVRDDFSIYNPFLHRVLELLKEFQRNGLPDPASALMECRAVLTSKYSFSIPTFEILKIAASCSPLAEIGAGSGYWAMCLSELGADVIAFDNRIPGEHNQWDPFSANPWHDDTWYHVDEGDERTAALYPERTLFLSWPPPESRMAFDALEYFRDAGGRRLLYLGSPFSTADSRFHDTLRDLKTVLCRSVPGWPGIRETMCVYEW